MMSDANRDTRTALAFHAATKYVPLAEMATLVDAGITVVGENRAQELEAKNFYRPRLEAVAAKYAANFPQIPLFTIDGEFGGWDKAKKDIVDRIWKDRVLKAVGK